MRYLIISAQALVATERTIAILAGLNIRVIAITETLMECPTAMMNPALKPNVDKTKLNPPNCANTLVRTNSNPTPLQTDAR